MTAGIEWVERVRCLCGSDASQWTRLAAEPVVPPVAVMRCRICDLAFITPYPSEATIGLLYAGNHAANDTNFEPVGETIVDRLKNVIGRRQIRAMVPRATRPAVRSVLDFGTGNGRFALLCEQVFPGATIEAIDYSDEPPVALEGRAIRYSSVESWACNRQQYDLVLLRHVLEHNHDPAKLIAQIGDRLTPTGRLYVEVPNLDSWFVKGLAAHVNTFAVPYHLFHFNARSLRSLVEAAGLTCAIGNSEMPLVGTSLAMLLRRRKNLAFQVAGIAMHPLQVLLSATMGKPCVTALCRGRTGVAPLQRG
jgi:2-polyprenyl-3-methyl-5-hydroxy-6-metoxy-1,4-benzoquinol methylase